jgi:soluble lytic murein transglycosylase-like protein
MREALPRKLSIAVAIALPLLVLGTPAAGESPDGVSFEELHAEALRTATAALSQAAKTLPRQGAATALPQKETRLQMNIPAEWRQQLSPYTWSLLQQSFEAEGVPPELLSVGWVESRFTPWAISPKGARGVWQLMPATARRYGLDVSHERDERTRLGPSTRVAARYLADLKQEFGDWLLALAAYNAGELAVQRAIERAGVADFWNLSRKKLLPAETRNYVPAVLRAMELLRSTQDHQSLTPRCLAVTEREKAI